MVEETSAAAASVTASWLTPSWLFLFLNLIIGTIAITSRLAAAANRHQQPPGHQLPRSTSLLQRLISFDLRCHNYHPESVVAAHADSVQEGRGSIPLSRFDLDGFCKAEKQEEDHGQPQPDRVDPTRDGPTRSPSLLERLKSIPLYRSKSTKIDGESGSKPEPKPESKSARPCRNISGRVEAAEEEEGEGVDKKADDFINRFRQQLRLQRLDSILRYRDMLKRN